MVSKKVIGQIDNKDIYEFSIENGDLKVNIIEYGAIVHNIFYKGTDCVSGYDNLEGYLTGKSHQGATIGRFANRIENATFTLNGIKYNLDVNSGKNCSHGGLSQFSHRVYKGEISGENSACFTITSADGESGFPGNLTLKVTFTVDNDALKLCYEALSDKDTVINFTNHAYFTLGAESCLNTMLKINADQYTPLNDNMVPKCIVSVENTPFDFRNFKEIGRDINSDDEQIKCAKGYDHNLVLSNDVSFKKDVAEARCYETKIGLTCSTDLPGLQIYTACKLNEPCGKNGKPLTPYSAFCLETQFFPNSPNEPNFPSCVIRANDAFKSVTEYKFFSI